MISHFGCDELVDVYFVVGGKFITENAFDGLQEMDVEVHVLVMTI